MRSDSPTLPAFRFAVALLGIAALTVGLIVLAHQASEELKTIESARELLDHFQACSRDLTSSTTARLLTIALHRSADDSSPIFDPLWLGDLRSKTRDSSTESGVAIAAPLVKLVSAPLPPPGDDTISGLLAYIREVRIEVPSVSNDKTTSTANAIKQTLAGLQEGSGVIKRATLSRNGGDDWDLTVVGSASEGGLEFLSLATPDPRRKILKEGFEVSEKFSNSKEAVPRAIWSQEIFKETDFLERFETAVTSLPLSALSDRNPEQAVARIAELVEQKHQITRWVAVGTYVIPVLTLVVLIWLAWFVALAFVHVQALSDRMESDLGRSIRWVLVAAFCAIATTFLTVAITLGMFDFESMQEPVAGVGFGSAPLLAVGILLFLTTRLRTSLRRNRREA